MFRLLVLSLAVATTIAGPLSGDKPQADVCVPWDDKIGDLLFKPLQTALKEKSSEYIELKDLEDDIFGFGIEWKNGKAGNFSSLQLNNNGAKSSSEFCNKGELKTLTVNVGFGDLVASFDEFKVFTPFFGIGGAASKFSLEGENLLVGISTITNQETKVCTARLDSFLFNKWGALELDLGGGILNTVISKVFNLFVSNRIIGLLESFGVGERINGFAVTYLTPVMGQYSDLICQSLNAGF